MQDVRTAMNLPQIQNKTNEIEPFDMSEGFFYIIYISYFIISLTFITIDGMEWIYRLFIWTLRCVKLVLLYSADNYMTNTFINQL